MWVTFISFLTSKIAGPLFGVIGVVLAVALAWTWIEGSATKAAQGAQIASLTKKLDRAHIDLDQCQVNRIGLQNALDAQNAGVAKVKADGDAATASANAALAKARAAGAAVNQNAAAILAAKPTSSNLCAAAEAVLTPEAVQ